MPKLQEFTPDYTNMVKAAKNIRPLRMPLYEHGIADEIIEKILNKKFADLYNGNKEDKREYFRIYNGFYSYIEIGKLITQMNWLKKNVELNWSRDDRIKFIDLEDDMAISRQAELLRVLVQIILNFPQPPNHDRILSLYK